MKITHQKSPGPAFLNLSEVHEGDTVSFKEPFSGLARASDVFVVNKVCNSYVPDCIKNRDYYPADRKVALQHGDKYDSYVHLHPHGHDDWGGVAVTNLRNGRLSFVDGIRLVLLVEAEVRLGNDTA